jgi:hypothetical protein
MSRLISENSRRLCRKYGLLGQVFHEAVVGVVIAEGQLPRMREPFAVLGDAESVQGRQHYQATHFLQGDQACRRVPTGVELLKVGFASQECQARKQDGLLDQGRENWSPVRLLFVSSRTAGGRASSSYLWVSSMRTLAEDLGCRKAMREPWDPPRGAWSSISIPAALRLSIWPSISSTW